MSAQDQAVFDSAMSLAEPRRIELLHALLDSVVKEEDVGDQELSQELERRLQECRDDPNSTKAWSEVKQMR